MFHKIKIIYEKLKSFDKCVSLAFQTVGKVLINLNLSTFYFPVGKKKHIYFRLSDQIFTFGERSRILFPERSSRIKDFWAAKLLSSMSSTIFEDRSIEIRCS